MPAAGFAANFYAYDKLFISNNTKLFGVPLVETSLIPITTNTLATLM